MATILKANQMPRFFRCCNNPRPRNRPPRSYRGGVHERATEPGQLHDRSVACTPFGLRDTLLKLEITYFKK